MASLVNAVNEQQQMIMKQKKDIEQLTQLVEMLVDTESVQKNKERASLGINRKR